MKKFLALLLALTMALALVACGGGDDAASDTSTDDTASGDTAATGEFEPMTWKFACSATETSPWVDGAKEFARIVGEQTGGAITGVPDEERGYVVKATIVLCDGFEPSDGLAKELQQFVKKETAPYKYPRIVEFVSELPKTISGKIRRAQIREQDQ